MKRRISLNPSAFVIGSHTLQTFQESVMRCNRCNACLQSCPSYLIKPEETSSPRGRVQFLRLILEKKIKAENHIPLLQKSLLSCLQCGKCSLACAAHIPVAGLVTSFCKTANIEKAPKSFVGFLRLQGNAPRLFDFLIRLLQGLRRWYLLPCIFISKKSSLYWLKYAHRILPKPKQCLQTALKKTKFNVSAQPPDFIYLPSMLASYIDPEIGLKTLQYLGKKKIHILFQTPCGLAEHLYGQDTRCLTQAKHLLTLWEKVSAGKAPLVTDSWEVYAFLKNYPALFASLSGWQKRAEAFAAHVHFVADYIKPVKSKTAVKTVLDFSGLLFLPPETISLTRKILKTQAGKNLLECDYSRFPIAWITEGFVCPCQTEKMLLENVKDLARQQIEQVYCLSGWAAFTLNYALKRHYPTAQARHIVYLQDRHD